MDPKAETYHNITPYSYVLNNPIHLVDLVGEDPYDPRTGNYLRINLWRDGVSYIDAKRSNPDMALYNRADRNFLGVKSFPHPRKRGKPDGIWEGANYNKHTYAYSETSKSAVSKLENDLFSNVDHIASYSAPNDNMWQKAAQSGTYTFLNSAYSESEFFQTDLNSFNVVQVTDNVITRVATLTRSEDGEFDVSSVSSYDVSFGEIQEKTKKTWWGGTKTIQYRTVQITETTQQYQNNEEVGDPQKRKYSFTQIL